MKILQIVDIFGWAIDQLATTNVKYSQHFDWNRIAVHPRALQRGELDLEPIRKAIVEADIIDANYWRTLSQLSEMIPEIKSKKIILTHHNEKNLLSEPWDYVDVHVTTTKRSYDIIKEKYGHKAKIYLIHNSFDSDRFKFNTEYLPQNDKPVVGYVGRIVPWKGLKEILQVCHELGYTLMLMGKNDKADYWTSIPEEHKACIDYSFFNCEDKDVPEFYKNIDIYVGNSGSGRETGPLGLIEAMASGVPCVTTNAGIANDICEDNENALVVDYDDYLGLKAQMQNLVESAGLRSHLRSAGWDTIRNFNHEKRGLMFRQVLNDLMYENALVSVVIPATYSRVEEVKQILSSLSEQTYKDFEVIVVWDSLKKDIDIVPLLLGDPIYPFVLKEHITDYDGYGLAMARNIGVIEADGDYIMFCDSRLKPEKDAIESFIDRMADAESKSWLFGNKGNDKKTFVENFSFIYRDEFIRAGMMNERIDGYGGMSQELRQRFTCQGFSFVHVPEAKAQEITSAKKDTKRRDEIIRQKNKIFKMYGN